MQRASLKEISPDGSNREIVVRLPRIWECKNQNTGVVYELAFVAVDHEVHLCRTIFYAYGTAKYNLDHIVQFCSLNLVVLQLIFTVSTTLRECCRLQVPGIVHARALLPRLLIPLQYM